jgi:hypothetical protein
VNTIFLAWLLTLFQESYDVVHEHIQGPELHYKWSMW